jgi:O-antigen/teichoic acid export membrane protein
MTLLLAQCVVNASNFGFHLVVSRLLGPASYGALGSLLAILTALSVPAAAFETIVSARVAHSVERGDLLDARPAWRRSLLVGVAGMVVMLGATPIARGFLHFPSIWPWVWLSLYCVPLALTVVPWGLVCGQRRFAAAGCAALTGALTRISVGVLFIDLGWGVSGAIAASVVGDSLRVLMLARAAGLDRRTDVGSKRVRLRIQPGQAARGALAFTGLWMLLGVDTVLARHFFAPIAAGQYAAASMAARAAFFMSQALCVLAVPWFASADLVRARRALRWTLSLAGALGVAGTAAIGVLGPRMATVVFGAGFRVDTLMLVLLGLAATELSVVWVALQYQLARGQRPSAAGWTGIVLAAVGAALWHQDGTRLALVMLVSLAAALVIAVRSLGQADRRPPRPAMSRSEAAVDPATALDLTVVVPFYNPGDLLRPNLVSLLTALRRSGATFEVITVEDGCTDDSAATIADLEPDLIRRLVLPRNIGKGAALRTGLSEARGRYIGFIDADGDLDPALWEPFLTLIKLYRPDAIVGSKVHPLSDIDPDVTWTRRACSAGYRLLVRVLFPRLPMQDTQVGIKVFRRELLEDVLPHTVERGFVFDLELLVTAQRMGYRRIMPAPVTLRARVTSTVTLSTVARMARDTVALAWRVHLSDSYDLGRHVAGEQATGGHAGPANPARMPPAEPAEVAVCVS